MYLALTYRIKTVRFKPHRLDQTTSILPSNSLKCLSFLHNNCCFLRFNVKYITKLSKLYYKILGKSKHYTTRRKEWTTLRKSKQYQTLILFGYCIEHLFYKFFTIQKQSLGCVPWKRCSWKFNKIHRKTPVPESYLKKRLWHMYFPVNFVKFLRTPFFYRTPLVAAFDNSVLWLSTVNYFCKALYLRCLAEFLICLWYLCEF